MNDETEPAAGGASKRWEQRLLGMGERSDYKKVWNRQAEDSGMAKLAVAGHEDEKILDETAEVTIRILREAVGIFPHDVILEIGCGVGRVGKPLSRQCLHWFGADISGVMLKHAAHRLRGLPNVTLVELATVGLREFPDAIFDVVYCTVVFMHLFEWDRYRYVQEAHRVLRPGGRCYFDNVPFDTDHGWEVFTQSARYPIENRPAHLSMVSSREELRTYLTKAGFLHVQGRDEFNGRIAATGRKSGELK
ncbi:MAG: methyltransferase domain-containing protein [Opitutaceae bacterium]